MENLRALRKQNNLKQSDLAEILNISASSIGMYEQGRREPDIFTLKKLADYFNVSIDYLLDYKEMNIEKFNDTKNKLIDSLDKRNIKAEDLNKLSTNDIELLITLVEKFVNEKK